MRDKSYRGSRGSQSPGDVPRVRVGSGWAEILFGSNLSVALVSTVRMWNEAVSQCKMKGHKPSVSLESIDAVNLITGSENRSLKSTIRGIGQDNCFHWGIKEKFCILLCSLWKYVVSMRAGILKKLTHEGWPADCSAWKFMALNSALLRIWKKGGQVNEKF